MFRARFTLKRVVCVKPEVKLLPLLITQYQQYRPKLVRRGEDGKAGYNKTSLLQFFFFLLLLKSWTQASRGTQWNKNQSQNTLKRVDSNLVLLKSDVCHEGLYMSKAEFHQTFKYRILYVCIYITCRKKSSRYCSWDSSYTRFHLNGLHSVQAI